MTFTLVRFPLFARTTLTFFTIQTTCKSCLHAEHRLYQPIKHIKNSLLYKLYIINIIIWIFSSDAKITIAEINKKITRRFGNYMFGVYTDFTRRTGGILDSTLRIIFLWRQRGDLVFLVGFLIISQGQLVISVSLELIVSGCGECFVISIYNPIGNSHWIFKEVHILEYNMSIL